MQEKKNPKLRLENYSKIFIQLGLVLTLFVVYVVIEQKTYEKNFEELGVIDMTADLDESPPITVVPEPELPKPKPQIPTDPVVIDNDEDIQEDIFETTEPDEDDEVFDINTVEEVTEDATVVEDVPFHIIEDVPVFPGCEGNNEALKLCFNKKMQKHFAKKFNSDLPNELGLPSGKKRIIMLFKIDRTGEIIDIRVKAPHPKLEKEATRIINLLPKMKPGKQRGNPVGVKYTLPMRIDVE
jgi:protein TonB